MISVATLLRVVFAVESCIDGHVLLKIGFASCVLGCVLSHTRQKIWIMLSLLVAVIAVVPTFLTCALQNIARNAPNIYDTLGAQLSQKALIAPAQHLVRWSDFEAPKPGTVVTVDSADDALLTVCYIVLVEGFAEDI